ncbi:MAG TPA: STAS domain-containing protein [Gemmataceae bacterium]|nr:STAS domain-containing protein [Gemmataceae bacterium]
MSQPRYRHLKNEVDQGILILTLSPSRLEGDAMAESLVEEMGAAVAQAAADKVVVNLEHVEYLTSANFRPFLAVRRQLQSCGGQLVLCGLKPAVAEIFHVTRLVGVGASSSLFQVQPDVAAAVALLTAKPASGGSKG